MKEGEGKGKRKEVVYRIKMLTGLNYEFFVSFYPPIVFSHKKSKPNLLLKTT